VADWQQKHAKIELSLARHENVIAHPIEQQREPMLLGDEFRARTGGGKAESLTKISG
jgi:hypothetical protein